MLCGEQTGHTVTETPKGMYSPVGEETKNHSHIPGRGGITEQGPQDPDTKLGKALQSGYHLDGPGRSWQRPLKAAPKGITPHLPQSLGPPDNTGECQST